MPDLAQKRPYKLLLVDDEEPYRKALRLSLTAVGYAVREAADGAMALSAIQSSHFDIVLLDMNMSGMDGVQVCRQIRNKSPQTAVVMVTVRDQVDDKLRAFDAGADDYVVKPFPFREFISRLRAVMRRTQMHPPADIPLVQAGDFTLDLKQRELRKAGKRIPLSPKEFALMSCLMRHQGLPMDRDQLLQAIGAPRNGKEVEYLRTYIRLLRKRIEDDPGDPKYIRTDPWRGYRFSILECS